MSSVKKSTIKGLLGYKLKKTQHALRLRMDEALGLLELTTPQYAVLAQLELDPGISNAVLARRSFITPQTMHGIVSKLEARGLMCRKSHPDHGRILCAELTEKGVNVVQEAHHIVRTVEEIMISTLSDDHKVFFEDLLDICLVNLTDELHNK
jgi:DNA-binding MarR family transcriptional regulator